MVRQDLTTACFTKTMGDNPDADYETAFSNCNTQWMEAAADSDEELLICANAVIDMAPYYNSCNLSNASTWCVTNNNKFCDGCNQVEPKPECYDEDKK